MALEFGAARVAVFLAGAGLLGLGLLLHLVARLRRREEVTVTRRPPALVVTAGRLYHLAGMTCANGVAVVLAGLGPPPVDVFPVFWALLSATMVVLLVVDARRERPWTPSRLVLSRVGLRRTGRGTEEKILWEDLESVGVRKQKDVDVASRRPVRPAGTAARWVGFGDPRGLSLDETSWPRDELDLADLLWRCADPGWRSVALTLPPGRYRFEDLREHRDLPVPQDAAARSRWAVPEDVVTLAGRRYTPADWLLLRRAPRWAVRTNAEWKFMAVGTWVFLVMAVLAAVGGLLSFVEGLG